MVYIHRHTTSAALHLHTNDHDHLFALRCGQLYFTQKWQKAQPWLIQLIKCSCLPKKKLSFNFSSIFYAQELPLFTTFETNFSCMFPNNEKKATRGKRESSLLCNTQRKMKWVWLVFWLFSRKNIYQVKRPGIHFRKTKIVGITSYSRGAYGRTFVDRRTHLNDLCFFLQKGLIYPPKFDPFHEK